MVLAFKNGVKSIQTAGYNGARTVVVFQISSSIMLKVFWTRYDLKFKYYFIKNLIPLYIALYEELQWQLS